MAPVARPDIYPGPKGAVLRGGKLSTAPAPGTGTGTGSTPAGVLTTVTLVPDASRASVPLTFGHPFKTGDWNPTTHDLQIVDGETPLASQTDELALHPDGSVRFAVCSAIVPGVSNAVEKPLNLRVVPKTPAPAIPALSLPSNWNFTAKATIYRNQVTRIKFTNRSTGGYVAGETVTMTLSGLGATETYTVTIKSTTDNTTNQTGAGYQSGANIAKEFVALAASSPTYDVYRLNGQGYERVWIKAKNPAAGAFTVNMAYAGTAVITQVVDQAYGGEPQVWTVPLRDAVLAKIASLNAGTPTTGVRLRGPAVTELEFDIPFRLNGADHPHLQARPSVRLYNGGARIRVDMVTENNWTFTSNPRPITYSMVFENGGGDVFTQPTFVHEYGMRWHKITWFGENPEVFFRHNVPYLLDSKAFHNYDRTLKISQTAINTQLANLNTRRTEQAKYGPLGWMLWEWGMGSTGGRSDLGPSPIWYVMHLLAQDPRTKEVMLAQADAAVCYDIHYRDETNGNQILNIENYPTISTRLYTSGANPLPSWRGPNATETYITATSSDFEHQADFAYLPYVLTGELFYLDELLFWGAYCLHGRVPSYRDNALGRVVGQSTVRAQAWSLRTVACAARIAPETHPLKGAFTRAANHNFAWMANYYSPSNPNVSPLGAPPTSSDSNSVAPWQADFMATTLSLAADNGSTDAASALAFIANFTAGRFNTPDFCIRVAPGYYWGLRNSATLQFLTTWQQVYEKAWPNAPIGQCPTYSFTPSNQGYPGSTIGYAAQALGALGAVHRSGIAAGKTGYEAFRTLSGTTNAFASDPTWAIVPVS